MSPAQLAQIRLRLDKVAAQRAEQAIKAPSEAVKAFSRALVKAISVPKGATVAGLVKGVVTAASLVDAQPVPTKGRLVKQPGKPVTDAPSGSDAGNAARCKRKRVGRGEAGKKADAARKRASRAKGADRG